MKGKSRLRAVSGIPSLFLCALIAVFLMLLVMMKSDLFNLPAYRSINSYEDLQATENCANNDRKGKRHQQIRILCMVVSHPGQHNTQATAAHQTWTKRCTYTLFVSNPEPQITDDGYLDAVCSLIGAAAVLGEELQQFEYQFCVNGTGNVELLQEYLSENLTAMKQLPPMSNYTEWVEWFNPTFPTLFVPETSIGRLGLWNKTKFAFQHAYNNFLDDFDWFLKADDDTYFIIENLRNLLETQNSNESIYFGCNLRTTDSTGYMSGGAGYVLSRGALQRLGPALHTNQSWPLHTDPEDLNMGAVLAAAGVRPGDSRDAQGRPRFFPLSARALADPQYGPQPDWYWLLTGYAHSAGPECCSPHAISFHYMTASDMYFTELLLYSINRSN